MVGVRKMSESRPTKFERLYKALHTPSTEDAVNPQPSATEPVVHPESVVHPEPVFRHLKCLARWWDGFVIQGCDATPSRGHLRCAKHGPDGARLDTHGKALDAHL